MKQIPMFSAIILSIGVFVLGCSQVEKQQLEYYYYPDLNLYFDVSKKNYVFSLDGGNSWDTTKATDQNDPASLGEKVILQSASDSIWIDNPQHLQQYGGSVYKFVNEEDTLTDLENVVITEKKSVKRQSTSTTVEQEKPKKGLKKFLDNIFGKKKKDKD